ncbi:glycosyltransferase family 2 protein [[Mycoplasma] testudinis]|uniref:glycosyltransferase family 2 protein n=1 Tax=[Mycoplasma] testudinis TaxID=33924 RepID=UPI0004847D05|nr:glycosyltransferase family 2 protein [[Mycoplasma] testudinis]
MTLLKNPMVSILVTCFNNAKALPRLFQSIRHLESLNSLKFIFLDDGSNDETLSKLNYFKLNNKQINIQVLSNARSNGMGIARNTLLDNTSTPYFYYLDNQDYFHSKDLFFTFLYTQKTHNCDLFVPQSKFKKENSLFRKEDPLIDGVVPLDNLINPQKYLLNVYPHAWNIFIKTDFFKNLHLRFIQGDESGDFAVIYPLFLKATSCYSMKDDSYTHISNKSGILFPLDANSILELSHQIHVLYQTISRFDKIDIFTKQFAIENKFFRDLFEAWFTKQNYKNISNNPELLTKYIYHLATVLNQHGILYRLNALNLKDSKNKNILQFLELVKSLDIRILQPNVDKVSDLRFLNKNTKNLTGRISTTEIYSKTTGFKK